MDFPKGKSVSGELEMKAHQENQWELQSGFE